MFNFNILTVGSMHFYKLLEVFMDGNNVVVQNPKNLRLLLRAVVGEAKKQSSDERGSEPMRQNTAEKLLSCVGNVDGMWILKIYCKDLEFPKVSIPFYGDRDDIEKIAWLLFGPETVFHAGIWQECFIIAPFPESFHVRCRIRWKIEPFGVVDAWKTLGALRGELFAYLKKCGKKEFGGFKSS